MSDPVFRVTADCVCGCGVHGSPKRSGHVKRQRLCRCPACVGGQNRRRGMSSQRKFQKAAGIRESAFRGANGNEESWRDAFRWEHKDGAQVRPVATAYLRCRAQADQNLAYGDPRPFAMGVTVGGLRLVVVEADTWAAHVAPLLGDPA